MGGAASAACSETPSSGAVDLSPKASVDVAAQIPADAKPVARGASRSFAEPGRLLAEPGRLLALVGRLPLAAAPSTAATDDAYVTTAPVAPVPSSCVSAIFFLSPAISASAAPRSTCATAIARVYERSASWKSPSPSCASAHHIQPSSSASGAASAPAHEPSSSDGSGLGLRGSSHLLVKRRGVAPPVLRTPSGCSACRGSASSASRTASLAEAIAPSRRPCSSSASHMLSCSCARVRSIAGETRLDDRAWMVVGACGSSCSARSKCGSASAERPSCIAHSARSLSRLAVVACGSSLPRPMAVLSVSWASGTLPSSS